MNTPTLFRTEAISKLSEAVKNIQSTQQTLQSAPVRSKVYPISTNDWYGSLKLVQDQLGVFVILSFGNNDVRNAYIGDIEIALGDLALPISLNPESDVYRMVKEHGRVYIIGTDGLVVLRVANRDDGGLGISLLYNAEASYEGHCTCIYGLIPDATLNIETEEINH